MDSNQDRLRLGGRAAGGGLKRFHDFSSPLLVISHLGKPKERGRVSNGGCLSAILSDPAAFQIKYQRQTVPALPSIHPSRSRLLAIHSAGFL